MTSTKPTVIVGTADDDLMILKPGQWALAGDGQDTIVGVGSGSFGIRFDNSPGPVVIRADNQRVVADGFVNRDKIIGINAFVGSPFDDFIRGSGNTNEVFGDAFAPTLGNDTYIGGGGFDTVVYFATAANYQVTHDPANDRATVTYLPAGTVDTLEGIAEIRFADRTQKLKDAGRSTLEIFLSPGVDTVDKTSLLDANQQGLWTHVYGGLGDDVITWTSGNVIAGPGNDRMIVTGSGDTYAAYWDSPMPVYIQLGEGYALDGWGTRDSFTNVRAATGSRYADTIIGSSGNDVFSDSSGGDTIDGAAGTDRLYFWTGGGKGGYKISFDQTNSLVVLSWQATRNSQLYFKNIEELSIGRPGQPNELLKVADFMATLPGNQLVDQTKTASTATGVVRTGAGSDTVMLKPGSWVVASEGFDFYRGIGAGWFGIRFDDSPKAVRLNANQLTVFEDGFGQQDRIEGINWFVGSPFNDYIEGRPTHERFGSDSVPPQGNDTYVGGGGVDTMFYFANASEFKVIYDTASDSATVQYLKTGTIDTLRQIGTIQFKDQNLKLGTTRNNGWDEIYLSDAADAVDKGELFTAKSDRYWRWDHVYGGQGDDVIAWTSGQIYGGPGNDTIIFLEGATNARANYGDSPVGVFVDLKAGYALDGWGTRDQLVNVKALSLSNLADTVIGSDGDDNINYSYGGDSIDGGAGEDTIWFNPDNTRFWRVKASEDLSTFLFQWVNLDGWGDTMVLNNVERIDLNPSSGSRSSVELLSFVDWQSQGMKAVMEGGSARWNAQSSMGTPTTVTYAFMSAIPSYGNGAGGSGLQALSESQKAQLRKAFDAASMVSGLSFQEINDSDTVQIRVGVNQQTNTKGYSFSPDRSQAALAGDIWLDVETVVDLTPGKEGFWVMLHELGHALGLRHPALIGQAKGQATITAQQDNMGYSVMSENLGLSGRFPESFSVYDVLALQALYGPSQSNLGNSTYVVGTASVLGLKTLVDGSGWDIIDASQSSIGVTVNLSPGSLSSVGRTPDDYAAFENLAIAYGTTIEQVNGSVYDDVLIGSQGNDWFVPGEGNDQIEGRAGFDTVVMAGPRAAFSFSISPFSGRTIVTAKDGVSGSDSLTGIERLKFTDGGVAFDMDGAAGRLVKLMATVLGQKSLQAPALVNRYLAMLDSGMSVDRVADWMLNADEFSSQWGPRNDNSVANALVQHVFQRAPNADERAYVVSLLQEYGQGVIAMVASNLGLLTDQIDLVGLSQLGLPYGP